MKRASLLIGLALGFAQFCMGVCQAQNASKGHFHFAGPMSAYMLNGAAPGRVATGLHFTLVLTDRGATIAPNRFDLKGAK